MNVELLNQLNRIGRPKILVFGDLILDRYTWGDAQRISPEAPVMVLSAQEQEVRLGGAASVAGLLSHLDAEVFLAGVIGDDAGGRTLQKLTDDAGIDSQLVLCDAERPTTVKQRFIGRAAHRHGHQILRVDSETTEPLEKQLQYELCQAIGEVLPDCQAVLISDYGKGVCTPKLLAALIAMGAELDIPVIVDPARGVDYQHYSYANMVTPNRLEAAEASRHKIEQPQDALKAGLAISQKYGFQDVLITLDKDGIAAVSRGKQDRIYPTKVREVYDVTGAGDTVLAMAGLCKAAGLELATIVQLANLAASLQVQKVGVGPISWEEIRQEIEAAAAPRKKLVSGCELSSLGNAYRRQNKKVVFTNGCFDLLHVGHVGYLQQAADFGDVLVVAINNDQTVKRLKGDVRPVIEAPSRAAMLAALECVDHVVIFDEQTPHRLLELLQPDVLVKGGTYSIDEVVGREVVQSYGGQVRVAGETNGVSTSQIIGSIKTS